MTTHAALTELVRAAHKQHGGTGETDVEIIMSKYHNKKTEVDGIVFDSKKEAMRYQQLRLLEKAGLISDLELQPQYRLYVNNDLVCRYVADFQYIDNEASKKKQDFVRIVEDVKGVRTATYRLKKKLMKAVYGIEITEV